MLLRQGKAMQTTVIQKSLISGSRLLEVVGILMMEEIAGNLVQAQALKQVMALV